MKNRKTRRKIYTESNAKQYTYDQPYTKCDRICPAKSLFQSFSCFLNIVSMAAATIRQTPPDLNTSQE